MSSRRVGWTRPDLRGQPSKNRNTAENFPKRFWRRVVKDGPEGCWLWQGSKKTDTRRGQVHVRWEGTKSIRKYAPIVAWELTHGTVPDGQRVLHNCPAGDNPQCVNPAHLFLGTQADNIHDSLTKGRFNAFGRQRLDAAQVREIRAQSRLGVSDAELGRRFGVKRHSINGIVHRKSWAWLPDDPTGRRVDVG